MIKNYKIEGLDCASCAAQLQDKIGNVKGVNSCKISFMAQRIVLDIEENNNFEELVSNINKLVKKQEPDSQIKW